MEKENVIVPAEFADICPISDKDFHNEMSILVEKPMFQQVVKFVMPDKKFSDVSRLLLSLNSKQEFQQKIMAPLVGGILAKTSDGITFSNMECLDKDTPYLHITNHRDIVLDSAQLSYLLSSNGYDTVEIAIGNNLLIYDWITKLVSPQ